MILIVQAVKAGFRSSGYVSRLLCCLTSHDCFMILFQREGVKGSLNVTKQGIQGATGITKAAAKGGLKGVTTGM